MASSRRRMRRVPSGGRGRPFDVIVLDYRLPDSNDLNLLSALRSLRRMRP